MRRISYFYVQILPDPPRNSQEYATSARTALFTFPETTRKTPSKSDIPGVQSTQNDHFSRLFANILSFMNPKNPGPGSRVRDNLQKVIKR